jgi:hypothetical protein
VRRLLALLVTLSLAGCDSLAANGLTWHDGDLLTLTGTIRNAGECLALRTDEHLIGLFASPRIATQLLVGERVRVTGTFFTESTCRSSSIQVQAVTHLGGPTPPPLPSIDVGPLRTSPQG